MTFGTKRQQRGWEYAMKHGNLNFAFDQGFALKKIHNPFVKEGVCNAMTYDWIKRGLCGAKVSSRTYQKIPRNISSIQMGIQSKVKSFADYAKKDGLQVHLVSQIKNIQGGALYIGMNIWKWLDKNKLRLNHGYAQVGFGGVSGGHAIAFRLAGYQSKFFDPNFGECKFSNEDEMRKFWNLYSEKMYWSCSEMHSKGFIIRTLNGIPTDAVQLLRQETMNWL